MSKKISWEKVLAYSTVALAFVTAFMAFETWKLASESSWKVRKRRRRVQS